MNDQSANVARRKEETNDLGDWLTLTIRTREKVIYEGEIKSLSSVNEKGRFDVLLKHGNFISLIQKFLRIREPNGELRRFNLESGVLRVQRNHIDVFLEAKR